MKIQYALDMFSIREALAMLRQVEDAIDIIEVGTPMLLRFGLQAVEAVKGAHPDKIVLADAKILDGGAYEADRCFEAGADIITVMGLAHEATLRGCVRSARRAGGRVLADTMRMERQGEAAPELTRLGIDYICVHNATDALDMDRAVAEAEALVQIVPAGHLAIAGGITPANVGRLRRFSPEILVVGNAITTAKDPRSVALALRAAYERGVE